MTTMDEKTEGLCLNCGIYHHLDPNSISTDDLPDSNMKLIENVFCTECGGELVIIDDE